MSYPVSSLPKPYMKSEGSGNVTILKFEIVLVINLVLVDKSEVPKWHVIFNKWHCQTLSTHLSLSHCDPDLLCWCGHQSMDRFHFLPFYEMKLESSNENGQEHQSLRNRESPSGTFSFPGKAKWLVSKAWKLFDVLWAETIRIKPKTGISISYKALASQKAIDTIS